MELSQFDPRFDRLWSRVERDYTVFGIRDFRYLRWRFDARPDANYSRFAALRGSELIGYLVCRAAPDSEGAAMGYLVDFLVEDRSGEIFAMLVWAAEQQLRRQDVKAIVCTVAPAPFREQLERLG
ncbi:MAG TPA: hypothetical protein VEJ86_06960 [Candidatus Binataceae bacterium]|nr:hypothetical protein [Candidatus Binataceae bacterium]